MLPAGCAGTSLIKLLRCVFPTYYLANILFACSLGQSSRGYCILWLWLAVSDKGFLKLSLEKPFDSISPLPRTFFIFGFLCLSFLLSSRELGAIYYFIRLIGTCFLKALFPRAEFPPHLLCVTLSELL